MMTEVVVEELEFACTASCTRLGNLTYLGKASLITIYET